MNNQAYSLNLACVGQDVVIWPMAKIITPEAISIGNSVIIDDFTLIMGGVKTIIGDFIHIASFTSLTGGGELIMENYSGLSSGVRVYTGNEDYNGKLMTNPTVPAPYRIPIRSFVRIEQHAIVGSNAVILPEVVIGEGAVIGANSLVTKDCDPWTIYVGSPAKPVRKRPSRKILELELQLRAEYYDSQGHYMTEEERKMHKEHPKPRRHIT